MVDSMAINREQGTLTVVSPLLTTKKNTGVVSYLDALPYLRKEDQRVTYLNRYFFMFLTKIFRI